MWQDTGFEYVHTKVMKKMLEVLRSDEQYGFMDDAAKQRLSDIRALCRNAAGGSGSLPGLYTTAEGGPEKLRGGGILESTERMILPLGETAFAVFPFLGTRGSMALMYALRQRGFNANIWLSRYIPVCIEVSTDMGIDALRGALDDIKQHGADKYSFDIPDNAEISGKFNDYIPRELLKKQYIEDFLDTDDLKNIE